MGRGRGPKFSFPIPGRKSHTKVGQDTQTPEHANTIPAIPAIPVIPAVPAGAEWHPRAAEETASISKAQRLLGNVPTPRPPSRSRSSIPQSPGYMTITVSEASFGSEYDDNASSTAVEDPLFHHLERPAMVSRSSSNLLGHAYRDDGRRGSNASSISRRLRPQASNSTMRSYYDPQKSPLSVSQQTSDSAVRDMALRKGMPPVAAAHGRGDHVPPLTLPISDDIRRASRKGKPARLDLSKLFPKPRSTGGPEHAGTLLSPNKLVNSPSAMSTASDYFPRPMTREPTPTPNTRVHAKLTKPVKRQQASPSQPTQSGSPVRMYKRDTYDSAKINVRRPPRGIQHWFEGLDEVSDEDFEEEPTPLIAPVAVKAHGASHPPIRKSSLGRMLQSAAETSPSQFTPPQVVSHSSRKDHLVHASSLLPHRLNSPSQFSVLSQSSTKTKESAMSRSNLQNSSVLSISSSDSESEVEVPVKTKVSVRKSIDLADDHGEIIIGKAQAFEMRPRLPSRAPSASKMSMLSTSTNSATIEMMYTPEPYNPHLHFPRTFGSRRSSQDRRSSHIRQQPSVIHEDDDVARPKTSSNEPMSPASTSKYSTRSEPRSHGDGHKLMAVTEEEEALLEMMRRKRAAMAKHSFTEGYKTALLAEEVRQKTPPELRAPRTSAFLMESPSVSPARAATASPQKPVASPTTPLLLPVPSRGRARMPPQDSSTGTSILHDSSSCDSRTPSALSARDVSPHSPVHHLSPPPQFSPLDPIFPSPAPTPTTMSVASPTTTEHASPLPSPVTPGLRNSGADISVKVATSEPSCDGEEEVAVTETGVIDPPTGSILKLAETYTPTSTIHQRRRTASSGADVSFGTHQAAKHPHSQSAIPSARSSSTNPNMESFELPPLSEALNAQPKIPRKSSRRTSTLTVTTGRPLKTRHSEANITSASLRNASPAANPLDRRVSRASSSVISSSNNSISSLKRESVALGSSSTRCSVSEDVLAAWGSLGGGLRDYDYSRV